MSRPKSVDRASHWWQFGTPRARTYGSKLRAALLGICLIPAVLVAQSSDTLGTKLMLSGQTLNLRWDPKHPWSSQMSSAGVQLFAEYVTARQGRVIQKLDAGRPAIPGDSYVTLRLPAVLAATPTSNVCLFLQVEGGRRIPLRKPRNAGTDTEHFAATGWAAAVSANSARQFQQQKQTALETAVASSTVAVQAQTAALQKRSWSDAANCERIQPPTFAPPERPADVLPTSEHEATARRVCIQRAVSVRQAVFENKISRAPLKAQAMAIVLPDPLTDAALLQYLHAQKDVDREDLRLREAEYLQYKTDWARWKAMALQDVALGTPPAFGGLDDELTVQDVTAVVGLEILNFQNPAMPVLDLSRHPATKDILGYLGGGMETYTRCVHDGQDELAAKLLAWNEQVQRAPMLEQIAKTQLRMQCVNAFTELDRQKNQLAALEQQLAAERQRDAPALHEAKVAESRTAVLNDVSCSVQ